MIVGVDPATSSLRGRQLDAVVAESLVTLLDDADIYLRKDGKFLVHYSFPSSGCCSRSESDSNYLLYLIQDGLVRSIGDSVRNMTLVTDCISGAPCYEGCGCECKVDLSFRPPYSSVNPISKHCKPEKETLAFARKEQVARLEIEREALYAYWMSRSHFYQSGPPELKKFDVVTGATGC